VKLPVDTGPKPVTGIVLRSQVIGGWPAMNIVAYDKDNHQLRCRRTAQLSKNILMVLFDGTIERICFSLPKEAVHLDLSRSADGNDWLSKAVSSVKLAEGLLKEQALVEFKPIVS
jgi:hypothetical protein